MSKRICIVSSGQPSANPRLVKEAVALSGAGYKIKVIYCPISPWADEYDKNLFQLHHDIDWVKTGSHTLKEKPGYYYARLRQKYYGVLYNFIGNYKDAAIRSMVLYSQELIRESKKNKADLYIGHNLGAMPAVIKAAKFHKAKAAFDFEDFHRGEDAENSLHWKKTKQTEEKYIPLLDYATAAAPLITKTYRELFPSLEISTINNCFPLSYSLSEKNELPGKPLKLIWFSQFIGQKRGLETVIEAIGKIGKENTELSLLGNCSLVMKNYFQAIAKENGLKEEQLKFIPAVEEKEIARIVASHHIGLACEVPKIQSRDLCLTNKIFMYLLAGSAIVFSNTKAQSLFLHEHPGIGSVYEQNDSDQLASILKKYMNEPELLSQHRNTSKQLGKEKLNWDTEKKILIQRINEIFEKK